METLLTFRRGEEIDQSEAAVSVLQKYWKAFAPKNVTAWHERVSNSAGHMIAAYVGNVLAGVLEAIRLDANGDPDRIPTTFQELTAGGTWKTHKQAGDTVILVDLTIAPGYHGTGLFEEIARYARETLESASGVIFTYSPLFADDRYRVVRKHERLGAKLTKELPRSRPGLTMMVDGKELTAEDVGLTAYTL
jgi:hypothetical protein